MPRKKHMEPIEFQVRLKLLGKDAEQFDAIKKFYNLKQNTEVIFFLINKEYKEIKKA